MGWGEERSSDDKQSFGSRVGTVAHPFYQRLNRVLEARGFDEWVEQQCPCSYADRMGRPSLAAGRRFRLLLIVYFKGTDCERGNA